MMAYVLVVIKPCTEKEAKGRLTTGRYRTFITIFDEDGTIRLFEATTKLWTRYHQELHLKRYGDFKLIERKIIDDKYSSVYCVKKGVIYKWTT